MPSQANQNSGKLMQSKPSHKTRLIYGGLVLTPFFLVVITLLELHEFLTDIAESAGYDNVFSATVALVILTFILFSILYVVGSLVHTRLGMWTFQQFEKKILAQIPGYGVLKNILRGFTDEEIEAFLPALVQLGPDGTKVIAFVMEDNGDGTVTVFVPNAPIVTIGGIHVVDTGRVTYLGASQVQTMTCISEWGAGSRRLLRDSEGAS